MRTRVCFAVTAAAGLLFSCSDPVLSPPPNVLVIVIDSLRARNLSCYGYERNTTPAIDSLAAEGTLWANCISQSSWTLPSMTSILTGLTERSHRAGFAGEEVLSVDPEAPFLPVLFRDRGYRTYGHFNVAFLDEDHGFSRGFESFRCERMEVAPADVMRREFLSWLHDLEETDRFFAVLHFFDPHAPYDPPAPFNSMYSPVVEGLPDRWAYDQNGDPCPESRDSYMALYDGEIAFADREIGQLFEYLREMEHADNTIIVILADHGEEFLEHGGVFHGHAFYQEIINVPLIMAGPGVPKGARESAWVGQYDLLPTLLGLCGFDAPEAVEGMDIISGAPVGERSIPSSGLGGANTREPWVCAMVAGGRKMMRLETDSGYLDLVTDLLTDDLELLYGPSYILSSEADGYLLTPRRWEPIAVERDLAVNPALRDLGYF